MANIRTYQPGQPANTGQPTRAKRQYLPDSVAAANEVALILVKTYGEQPWILQCMNGVQECVQNSIEMLSGQAPQANAMSLAHGGRYSFAARTREELQASQDQVASNGQVSAATVRQQQAAQQADQAMAGGDTDMFARLQRAAGLQDPATGQVAQPQEAPNEPRSDEWIL